MFQFPAQIARSRRRRQIRAKLDEIARLLHTYFRGAAPDVALLTSDGGIIAAKGAHAKPLQPVVHRVLALRAHALALAAALDVPAPLTISARGTSCAADAHILGAHTLLIYAPVPLAAHDAVLKNVEHALKVAPGPIAELAALASGV